MFQESKLTTTELAINFGLGTCHLFDISGTGNYSETTKLKYSRLTKVPIMTGNYNLELLREIGIDVNKLFLK